MKPTTSEWISVKSSSIHNKGVFAAKDIPKGTKIIEYVGDIVSKDESELRSDMTTKKNEKDASHGAVYIFELNKKFDIDGDVSWNTAKYINHSCDPNCEVEFIGDHIWIVSIRDIKKGEELNYDYGYDMDDYEDHVCKCGAKNCCGYIIAEDLRGKLKKKIVLENAKKKRALKRKKTKSLKNK